MFTAVQDLLKNDWTIEAPSIDALSSTLAYLTTDAGSHDDEISPRRRNRQLWEKEQKHRRTLKIKEDSYGPSHYFVATTLKDLAHTLRELGGRKREREAEQCLGRAAKIMELVEEANRAGDAGTTVIAMRRDVQVAAAVSIQRIARRIVALQIFKKKAKEANKARAGTKLKRREVMLQRVAAGQQRIKEREKTRRRAAATRLQSQVRRKKATRRVRWRRREAQRAAAISAAATRLQSQVRRREAMQRVGRKREEMVRRDARAISAFFERSVAAALSAGDSAAVEKLMSLDPDELTKEYQKAKNTEIKRRKSEAHKTKNAAETARRMGRGQVAGGDGGRSTSTARFSGGGPPLGTAI